MIKKHLVMVCALLLYFPINSYGQGYLDLSLLFSQTPASSGSARMHAIGGAQNALGADVGTIGANPAGLGVYRRNDISITASSLFGVSDTRFGGNEIRENYNSFALPNVGVVFANVKADTEPGAWRGGSFGISINRINDFNTSQSYAGRNTIDNLALGLFEADLPIFDDAAFPSQQLIDADGVIAPYYDFIMQGGNPAFAGESPIFPSDQDVIINTTGRQTATTLAYGGNFLNKFYVGGSVNFTSLRYRVEQNMIEVPDNNARFPGGIPDNEIVLDQVYYDEIMNISGTGVGANLGVIYRVIPQLTLGLSYATPTIYALTEENDILMESDFIEPNDAITEADGNSYSISDYTFRTPGKVTGGIAYFFQDKGFLSADVDYINFGNSRFRDNLGQFPDNDEISEFLTGAVNVRVGGEYRIQQVRFRLGYQYMGNMELDSRFNRERHMVSGGIGYRPSSFYMDLSLINSIFDKYPVAYPGASAPTLSMMTQFNAMLTLGFSF